jgi:hypothetical protein
MSLTSLMALVNRTGPDIGSATQFSEPLATVPSAFVVIGRLSRCA